MKALACLALALTACGSAEYAVQAPDASYGQLGHLDEGLEPVGPAELVDALLTARADWASAGVTEQAYVPWIRYAADMTEACHDPVYGPVLWGCWRPAENGLYVRDDMGAHPSLLGLVTHELGHALRQRGGHLKCADNREALMCSSGNIDGGITERDVAFVLDVP